MRAGEWGYTDQVADACPNSSDPNHRIGPNNYIKRIEWAEKLAKTHTQSQCPKCDLFVIWTPKKRATGKMGLSGNLYVDERDVS